MATKKAADAKPKRTTKKKVEAVEVPVMVVETTTAIDVDAAPVARPEPTADAIRQRAFEIWQARGGNAFDNWLAAEWELRGEA